MLAVLQCFFFANSFVWLILFIYPRLQYITPYNINIQNHPYNHKPSRLIIKNDLFNYSVVRTDYFTKGNIPSRHYSSNGRVQRVYKAICHLTRHLAKRHYSFQVRTKSSIVILSPATLTQICNLNIVWKRNFASGTATDKKNLSLCIYKPYINFHFSCL